jgi:hypothetical protein
MKRLSLIRLTVFLLTRPAMGSVIGANLSVATAQFAALRVRTTATDANHQSSQHDANEAGRGS